MEKKTINVGGYSITQLSETTYEFANPEQQLDFYVDAEDPEEVDVTVFDSLIATDSEQESSLGVFSASSLEEAVVDSMQFTKDNLKDRIMWE
jgi:hypothetical protein